MKAITKRRDASLRTANLGIVLILVLLFAYFFLILSNGLISETILLISPIFIGLSLSYAYIYVAYFGSLRKTLLLYTSSLAIVSFILSFIVLYFIGPNIATAILSFLSYYFPTLTVFFPLFLFSSFSLYVLRYKPFKKYSKFVSLCFFLGIALLIFVIFFLSAHQVYTGLDDEEFLAMQSVSALLSGKNPYLINVSSLELFEFLNAKTGLGAPTLTIKNGIMGFMDYPAMFFLPLLPFYLLAQLNASIALIFAIGVFGFVYLFSITYAIDKEFLKRPNYILYIIAVFAICFTSSVTNYLMLATLIIAYKKIDSKYLFVFLGLAASMQEMLWLTVLLFLVYVFNNKGLKSGFITTFATIAVFFVINGYFIALSPQVYFHNILAPLNNLLFPAPYAPFTQPLLTFYPISLTAFSMLFYAATAISLLLMAYTNRKQLIGLLGLVPLLFIYHAILPYYFFFLPFLIITLYIGYGSKAKKSLLFKTISKQKAKYLFSTLIILIIILTISYVLMEHAVYTKELNIGVHGGRLTATNKNVTYTATLSYNLTTPTNLYIFVYAFSKGNLKSPVLYGLFGQSILQNSTEHTVYNYTNISSIINSNRFTVYSKGSKTFTMIIPNSSITNLVCNIYTNNSYYVCPGVSIDH